MSTPTSPAQRIGPNTYYLADGQAVVSFSAARIEDSMNYGKIEKVSAPNLKEGVEIMSWGSRNDLPQLYEGLLTENNVVPVLMQRKRDIMVSDGLFAYQKRRTVQPDGTTKTQIEEVEMPAEAQAFFEETDIDAYLMAAAGELMKHSLIVPEFVRLKRADDKNRFKIASLRCHEGKYVRSGRKNDDGKVTTWYWCGHWLQKKDPKEKKRIVPLPVYTGEESKQPLFVLPIGDYFFNDGYYPIPVWRGGKDWIEMSNMIPEFHINNILNGYSIRFHIKIPTGYFLDYERWNACTTDEERAACKTEEQHQEQAFMNDVNKFLAGLDNAGRALFTKFEFETVTGKAYPGIEIVPINYDMKDTALLELFKASNTANVSNQAIHPSLANIDVAGKLFGSGTEVRNAYLLFLITSTPQVRRMMMKPIELVKKINGWPVDVFYGIRDFELAPLNEDKSGMKPAENQIGAA